MYLITGATWASGRVSDSVVELLRGKGEPVRVTLHRDDGRANRFRELGAEVVVADLTSAVDVVEVIARYSWWISIALLLGIVINLIRQSRRSRRSRAAAKPAPPA